MARAIHASAPATDSAYGTPGMEEDIIRACGAYGRIHTRPISTYSCTPAAAVNGRPCNIVYVRTHSAQRPGLKRATVSRDTAVRSLDDCDEVSNGTGTAVGALALFCKLRILSINASHNMDGAYTDLPSTSRGQQVQTTTIRWLAEPFVRLPSSLSPRVQLLISAYYHWGKLHELAEAQIRVRVRIISTGLSQAELHYVWIRSLGGQRFCLHVARRQR